MGDIVEAEPTIHRIVTAQQQAETGGESRLAIQAGDDAVPPGDGVNELPHIASITPFGRASQGPGEMPSVGWGEPSFLKATQNTAGRNTFLLVAGHAIWNRITSASMLTLVPVLTMFVPAIPNLTGGLSEGGMKE